MHLPSAEDVDVEVVDGLAAVGAGVEHQAVAVGEVLGAGDFAGGVEKLAEDGGVVLGGVRVRGEVVLGDDEDVRGRLGVDVREGESLLVFVEAVDGDFAGDDFAEEAAHSSE